MVKDPKLKPKLGHRKYPHNKIYRDIKKISDKCSNCHLKICTRCGMHEKSECVRSLIMYCVCSQK